MRWTDLERVWGRLPGPPLARLIATAAALVLAAACLLVGATWFFALPPRVLYWLGQGAFVALILGTPLLARRLGLVRPWGIADPPGRGGSRRAHLLAALALQGATASFALPLFAHPGKSGISDWDYHQHAYEAVRRTILEWGEFPWWDPWACGGFPLAAEPQVGVVSLDTALVLGFGTLTGLRLAAIGAMMIAVEGARRLARLWIDDPWGVALAAAVYGWNGTVMIWTAGGHAIGVCACFLPWILRPAFLLDRRDWPRQALMLGLALAASVLGIIQYPTAYALVLLGGVVAWGLLAQDWPGRGRMAMALMLAAGLTLLLAGWRLVTAAGVMRDYPRIRNSMVNDPFWTTFRSTVLRDLPPAEPWDMGLSGILESDAYIGPIALALAFLSLRRGWRWWHTLWIGCFALACGTMEWYQPSAWLADWPVFSTMHMVARWRLPGLLGLGLAAGDEVASWRALPRLRWLGPILVLGVACDLAIYGHQVLPVAFTMPADVMPEPGPDLGKGPPVNLEFWQTPGGTSQAYHAVRRGYGVIRGYQPLLTYDRRRPTIRLWRGHPAYIGEFTAGGKAVEPAWWSPNRVAFRLEPGQEVTLNANPGSWWWLEAGAGELRPFHDWKCAELTRPFVVRADARGDVILRIRLPDNLLILAATGAGLALVALALLLRALLPPDAALDGSGRAG